MNRPSLGRPRYRQKRRLNRLSASMRCGTRSVDRTSLRKPIDTAVRTAVRRVSMASRLTRLRARGRKRWRPQPPNPLDDRFAAQRGQREAGDISVEDETGHGRLETLDRHPQGNQGIKEAVGELDAARCDDQRPDLRARRPARPPSALPTVAADPGIYTGRAHPPYQDPSARRGGAGISTGRRTLQILSVSSVAPVSSWSRQQAEKRIRVAAGALFENRADNKLARMSVVMLHVKTVALVSSPCLNGAITPQHTVVVLKCALNIEKFDHY
jgi:hypothetical protein